jgi:1-aminocyclopropane-1-carboxylate deaminase/D-cysteine desulfhydrase-like pyridoxal-dependent ACC family enzyme
MSELGAIFVAGGIGGTMAGLSTGLAAAGLTVPIVGVRVTSRPAFNRPLLARAIKQLVAHLGATDDRFPPVDREAIASLVIDAGHLGGGYGVPTADGERASSLAAEDGLVLDPTYMAKAFAALLDAVRDDAHRGPLLFLSTLSSAPMGPLLEEAPATHPFTSA